MSRSISEIANEISKEWPKPNFAAAPYLKAMHELQDISDIYFCDPARQIVAYFLSNATSWRGESARRIKAELKELLKGGN